MCFSVISGALIVGFLAIAAGFFIMGKNMARTGPSVGATVSPEHVGSTPFPSPIASAGGSLAGRNIFDLIHPRIPSPNSVVISPLTVEGEARGNWYFEATFPLKIVDSDGNELGAYYAKAQGEWTTENFVPYRGIVEFENSTTETGFLVLERDNPSALPENAAEVRMPIRFSR